MRQRSVILLLCLSSLLWLGPGAASAMAQEAVPAMDSEKDAAFQAVLRALPSTLLISTVAALLTSILAIINAFSVLYFGTWTKRVLHQINSTLGAVPALILLLIVVREWTSWWFLGIILGFAIYPLIARQLLNRVTELAPDFQFRQARILGHGPLGVFYHYAWPRFLPLTLPYFFYGFIHALMLESMFSALGLFELESARTWGALIHARAEDLIDAPWYVFYAGIAIILTTLTASLCAPVVDRLLSAGHEA